MLCFSSHCLLWPWPLTFDSKSNQHICEPKYICDKNLVKIHSLVYEMYKVFESLLAVTLTSDLLIPKSIQHICESNYICHQNWVKFPSLIITMWLHVMQRTVLLSQFCPSVCPSACQMHVLWQNEIIVCQNRVISSLSTPTGIDGNCPLQPKIFAENNPPSFEKHRLRQISAYNVSIVKDSEQSSIMTNRKLIPTSYRWRVYVAPKSPEGWLKKRMFSFLKNKSQLQLNKVCY